MSRVLVAGVDTSTQSTKVRVTDAATGEMVRFGQAKHPDGTSVNPEAWWQAFQEAAEQAGGLDDVAALAEAPEEDVLHAWEGLGYYNRAMKIEGITGDNLMTLLESRLDNVVFRLGFARTRKEARQTVRHGHFTVNGKRVDIPSYLVKAGDVVAVGEKYRDLLPIKEALIQSERFEVPGWLEVDIEKLSGNVLSLPTREQISTDIQEQLIVELYSK